MKILGILNVTEDSFSDGGKFLAADDAIAHAERLMADGADAVDVGAASSNPDSKPVSAEIEIARLAAILPALKAKNISLSVDSFSPPVQRWALERGVAYLNDIHGFPDDGLYPALAKADCRLIVMHMVQEWGVAIRAPVPPSEIFERVIRFFDARIKALSSAGVARERIILDPGMGQFVGTDPENSLILLRRLPELKSRYGLPLLVSVSRKGFLRKLTGRPIEKIGPATLAAELFAVAQGADIIRTHDAAALRDGLNVLESLKEPR
jgi:dihydropteroate synthase type 2